MTIVREYGIHIVDSPAEIDDTMLRVLDAKEELLFSFTENGADASTWQPLHFSL